MNQSEIWLIDLEPTKGAEIRKTRTDVIINNNKLGKLPLKIIVPITDWKDKYEIAAWMVKISPNPINGLSKVSAIDCFQVRSVSEERLVKKIGNISIVELEQIKNALHKVFDL